MEGQGIIPGMMPHPPPSLFARLLRGAFELLAPPRCHGCGAALWGCENPFLCEACIGEMPWIGAGACPKCGFPAGKFAAFGEKGCARCRSGSPALDGVAAVVRYRGGARNMVRSLKFHGERQLAPAMGGLMADRWRAAGLSGADGIDMVVPVSLHPKRLRSRGFDQSALLAGVIAENLGIPHDAAALRRLRPTKPQALQRKAARLIAMNGVFAADAERVGGRVVLLVDDVFTTGSTMSAAAAACKKSGAKKVYGIAFAR